MMLRPFSVVVFGLTGLAMLGLPASAAVVGRHEAKVVAVTQTISGPTAGAVSKITVDVGMASQLNGAMSLSKGSLRISDSTGAQVTGLPAVNYGAQQKTVCSTYYYGSKTGIDGLDGDGSSGCQTVGLTEADIIAAANIAITANAAAIGASIATLINANEATTGIYTFQQDLGSSALSGQRRLVWTAVVDSSGKMMYGQSKIVSTTQFFLYVTYTPLAVAQGLPQSWQYSNPGTMSWTLVDSTMTALQAITTIDTGGAFDEPDGQLGSEVMLACLVDHGGAGCPAQYPDVVTLLAQSGASGAFVDYLHAVAPVYDNVESPVGSGQYISIAELVLQVPDRDVATAFDPTCLLKSYTYSNVGSYQFHLNHALTRYIVTQGQSGYTTGAQMAMTVISPWQNYSSSLTVTDDDLPALPSLYIDPFMQEGPLISTGDLPAGSSLGDVDYLPAPVCTPTAPPATPGS